jgi:RNA polymerase sigma factor (sigma-70 family)
MTTGQLSPVIRYVRRMTAPAAPAEANDAGLLARFASNRDEAAFAVLVRRHGPVVLGVCRRVLGNRHDAEDAFQATFLILARRAGSLHRPGALGAWLHGVAYRTAAKARADAARRRARERGARGLSPAGDPAGDAERRDLRALLDDEVRRLPDRYRVPFVLTYLEGKTDAEVARLLGCSRGTVATRLARARERLRRRLTQRGVGLSAGLAALLLTDTVRGAGLPVALADSTARAAARFAAGEAPAAGAVSTRALALAEGVIRTMLISKLRTAIAIVLATGLLIAGATSAPYVTRAGEPGTDQGSVPPPAPVDADSAPPPLSPAPAEADGQASHRTANFVVTAATPEVARRVARAAERHRRALAVAWLGEEMPAWPKPCPVRVRLTEQGPSSATSFAFDGGTVTLQSMLLEGPLDTVLADLLPHEVTHTVLAHWSGRPVARWADEGAAMLAESGPCRARHAASLQAVLDGGRRMPLRKLLPLQEYPEDVLALYAQGGSLTEFLVGSGGRRKFLAFVSQGARDGWDAAAEAQYGYRTVEELERAWLARASSESRGEAPTTTTPPRAGHPPPAASRADAAELVYGALREHGRWRSPDRALTITALEVQGRRLLEVALRQRREGAGPDLIARAREAEVRADPGRDGLLIRLRDGDADAGAHAVFEELVVVVPLPPPAPLPRGTEQGRAADADAERELRSAFGDRWDEVRAAAIKVRFPGLALAADRFRVEADGRVWLAPCWLVLSPGGEGWVGGPGVTAIRAAEVRLTLDGPVRSVADLAGRKLLSVESAGVAQISFRRPD